MNAEALVVKPAEWVEVQREWESAFLVDELTPIDRVWFGSVDGVVVGGMRLSCAPGRTGADRMPPHVGLDSLSVESRFRRRGYGRALMLFVHRWLADEVVLPNALSLGVDADNVGAIRLYESLGYQFVLDADGLPVTAPNGALIMCVTLG